MIHLCLLASGESRRFGSNKLLVKLNGTPVWEYGYSVLREIAKQYDAKIHVVSRYGEILDCVGKDGVFCPESANGLSYTVRCTCKACGSIKSSDKILFLVADQPFISVETVKKLIDVNLADGIDSVLPLAACASDGEKAGNPVIFSAVLTEKLMQLTGDRGGKAVLKQFPNRVQTVLCPSKELMDIDTTDDLNLLQ